MRRLASSLTVLLSALVIRALAPTPALACSAMFNPTIRALGPEQVVVLGTTGERVDGGRLFHVERWYNGGSPETPIVIAFQEGEPSGDCSYPVASGLRLIIAPFRDDGGILAANLATLQADPSSEEGRAYIAEAETLFGPGVVPPTLDPAAIAPRSDGPSVVPTLVGLSLAVLLVFGAVAVVARRRRSA